MTYKDNQYYYAREGRGYAIRQWHGDETGGTGTKTDYCWSKEEARSKVYQLNGWIQ